jgi:hypothetical protein
LSKSNAVHPADAPSITTMLSVILESIPPPSLRYRNGVTGETRRKQIQIAVIVEVTPDATARDVAIVRRDRAVRDDGETPAAVVSIEHISRRVRLGGVEVQITVVIEVAPDRALAQPAILNDDAVHDLRKRAVAIVVKEQIIPASAGRRHGHEHIDESIIVVIAPRRGEHLHSGAIENVCDDAGELLAVAKIAVEVKRPAGISRNSEIKMSVVVEVGPTRADPARRWLRPRGCDSSAWQTSRRPLFV